MLVSSAIPIMSKNTVNVTLFLLLVIKTNTYFHLYLPAKGVHHDTYTTTAQERMKFNFTNGGKQRVHPSEKKKYYKEAAALIWYMSLGLLQYDFKCSFGNITKNGSNQVRMLVLNIFGTSCLSILPKNQNPHIITLTQLGDYLK